MEQYLILAGVVAAGLFLCGVWYEVRKHRQVAEQAVVQQALMAPRTAGAPPAPGKSAALTSLEALHDKVDMLKTHLDTVDAVNEMHGDMQAMHAKVDGALRNAAQSMSELHDKVDSLAANQDSDRAARAAEPPKP